MTSSSSSPAPLPTSLAAQLDGPLRSFLEHRVLPGWMRERRWFRSKSRPLQAVSFESVFDCDGTGSGDAVFAIARVDFADGAGDDDQDCERYLLPLALVAGEAARNLPEAAILSPVTTPAGERLLIDGCLHEGFRAALFSVLSQNEQIIPASTAGGALEGRPVSATALSGRGGSTSRVLSAEQSNTSLVYGDGPRAVFVKLYRRVETGVHPEPEMLRFLSERTTFRHAPGFLSSLEWTDARGTTRTVALAQEFLPHAADAWGDMLEGLRAARAAGPGTPQGARAWDALRATAALYGRRVGEFHVAAASDASLPAFAPEAFTAADASEARARARASLAEGLRDVTRRLTAIGGPSDNAQFPAAEARAVIARRGALESRLDDALQAFAAEDPGLKIRTHGDLHLGQILIHATADGTRDARILDFEGEPGRPLAAARHKQSPLRDVAGMLRSFHYAAHAGGRNEEPPGGGMSFDPEMTSAILCDSFLEAYFTVLAKTGEKEKRNESSPALLPVSARARQTLLDLFVLEKAAYELQYECNNRPDWAAIPLRGLLALSGPPEP